MRKLLLPCLLALIGLGLGCSRDELDFDRLDNLNFQPNVQLPVASAKLAIDDLIQTDSVLVENPDGSLRIVFRQDDIASFGADNLIELPAQDRTPLPLVVGVPPFDASVSLGTFAGAELGPVNFKDGYLKFGVTAPTAPVDTVSFKLLLLNAVNTANNDTLTAEFSLLPGRSSLVDSIPVSDFTFDFSNGGANINFIGLRAFVTDDGGNPSGTQFDGFFQLTGMVIESAAGFFGQRLVNFPTGDFDLDLSVLNEFSEGLIFTNPSMRIITGNQVGLPVELNIDFDGVNEFNEFVALGVSPFEVSSPAMAGGMAIDTNAINAGNSNIVEFLAKVPNRVLYSGGVLLNPNGRPATPNFLSTQAQIDMDLEIEVPLEFKASRMVLEEVINDIKLTDDNPEFIQEMELFFKTGSTFPFDVVLNVAFLDSATGDSAAGFNLKLLQAAPVDNNGRADPDAPVQDIQNIDLNPDQIDGLLRSDALRFKAVLQTPNNGQTPIAIYTDYSLNIQLAARSKVKANL